MEPELVAMLTIPVTLAKRTGEDAYGNVEYDTAVSLDGFIDSVRRMVGAPGSRDGVGGRVEWASIPLLVIDGDVTDVPATGDRITAKGVLYDVDTVTLFYDDGEPHHYEIELNRKD